MVGSESHQLKYYIEEVAILAAFFKVITNIFGSAGLIKKLRYSATGDLYGYFARSFG
jgi:hypothetical protein